MGSLSTYPLTEVNTWVCELDVMVGVDWGNLMYSGAYDKVLFCKGAVESFSPTFCSKRAVVVKENEACVTGVGARSFWSASHILRRASRKGKGHNFYSMRQGNQMSPSVVLSSI